MDVLWDKFAASGRIEDYLDYAAHKDTENDNIRRDSPEGASCG
jgi:hypothetical protein